MGVEAAVRQADLLHDVGDARAVVPASPNGARGGPDDPFVGDLLAAWGGPPGGGSAHMMTIIYQSGAERKRPPGRPSADGIRLPIVRGTRGRYDQGSEEGVRSRFQASRSGAGRLGSGHPRRARVRKTLGRTVRAFGGHAR